ncbi:MAG: hypothetical protein NTY53_24085 [Kiritimatiellaeota bacterium]|nr:hypothetical protein [Kiritimatiellota bacterium]
MKNIITKRGNLKHLLESLDAASTVQPRDAADVESCRIYKYWVGRNLEIVRRELRLTENLQRDELRPIEGLGEFVGAKEQASLRFCKRDEKNSPIYVRDEASGKLGVEIIPEKKLEYRETLKQLEQQYAGVLAEAQRNERQAEAVLEQDVGLTLFTVPFEAAPERMAGGLLADLRFMLANPPAEPAADAPLDEPAQRYYGSQPAAAPAAPAAPWWQRWWRRWTERA